MGSRGSYKITSTEEGKAAQLDQSYKSCLTALIIIFFLCIILIIAGLFAQSSGKDYQSTSAMSQPAKTFHKKTVIKSIVETPNEHPRDPDEDSDGTPESPLPRLDHPSSTEKYTNTTEQPDVTDYMEHSLMNSVQPNSSHGPTSPTTDINTTLFVQVSEKVYQSTTATSPPANTIHKIAILKPIGEAPNEHPRDPDEDSDENPESRLPPSDYPSSTGNYTSTTEQPNDTLYIEDSLMNISTTLTPGAKDSNAEVESPIPQNTPNDETVESNNSTSEKNGETSEFIPNELQSNSSESDPSTTLPGLVRQLMYKEFMNDTNTSLLGVKAQQIIARSPTDISTCTLNACEDRGCKQVASKILSYMDHGGDACEDFYDYSCGGLEADFQITEKDLSRRAYETIKRQAEKTPHQSTSTQFNRYYDSCLNYEVTYNISERVKLAKETLEKIGKIYTKTEWENGHGTKDLNKMFTEMLKNNWPLLFDIVPDVDKAKPENFTLTIRPRQLVFDNKPFQFRHDPDRCENENVEVSEGHIDFDALYEMYETCSKNTERLMDSINRTLSSLHIFGSLDDGNKSESIDSTIKAIDVHIINGILKKYSSEGVIQEAYRSKKYTVMTLGNLQGNRTSIDWRELIFTLTESYLEKDTELYVYHEKELIDAMNELEQLWEKKPRELNNALLGLYSEYLYNTFVTPKSLRDLHNHCLYKTVHSMKDVASELYMQSFTEKEIERMNKMMTSHFEALKETLRLNIEKSTEPERESLLKKLNDTEMSLPKRSEKRQEEAKKLHINGNYFENSMKLMKNYRTVMYSMTKKKPRDEIWRFFATPFESSGQTITALNLIAIPYGAVEVDMKNSAVAVERNLISYLTLATIGNVIARQIVQNFDMTAMGYWNGLTDDETKDTYENENMSHNQSLDEYSTSVNWRVNGISRIVTFKVPTLSLNERFSDIVGLRLARDSLDRLNLSSTQPLPWLNLNVIQLFYLTYVQAHCTKAPLRSMYISLNENPLLPSRIRVYVASNNNGLFHKEWNCIRT